MTMAGYDRAQAAWDARTPDDVPSLSDERCEIEGCLDFALEDHEECEYHLLETAAADEGERLKADGW